MAGGWRIHVMMYPLSFLVLFIFFFTTVCLPFLLPPYDEEFLLRPGVFGFGNGVFEFKPGFCLTVG